MLVTLSILTTLGIHRLTRLVTRDKIPLIGVPRELFVNRWGVLDEADGRLVLGEARAISINGKPTNLAMSSLAYLWECDWCASIWIGALVMWPTWDWWPDWRYAALLVLACSTLTGMLAQREDRRGG